MLFITVTWLTLRSSINKQFAVFVHYMAFGNGATSVDTAGRVVYKTPEPHRRIRVRANLYSRTYWKPLVVMLHTETDTNYILQKNWC